MSATLIAQSTSSATTIADREHFEHIYLEAKGNAALIPWEDGVPHPGLVTWLNAVAPSLVRCGARVAVPGCGLGDDARELLRRGYDVCAFDCSPTAVKWAQQLDRSNASAYFDADLFDLPARWRHRFDLVVEVNTIQSLAPERHAEAIISLAELLSPHGRLLVIARAARDEAHASDGPPFPLLERDLREAANSAGLAVDGDICIYEDDETPPVLRMRALFKRV